jgi:GNAT superfamily N-acetyltransferase
MEWTDDRKRDAAIQAPLAAGYVHPDTQVVEKPGWFQVITPSAQGFLNEIAYSVVEPEDAERVIDDSIATYRALRKPVKWSVGPWTRPADFVERLRRRGFFGWDVRGMGIATAASIAAPSAIEIVEVDASTVDHYVELTLRGWSAPMDQIETVRQAHLASLRHEPRTMHFFGAILNGQWVGTASLMVRGTYGYLYLTQVLEQARGKGAYRALVAARLAALRARGIEYAVTQAREATSAPILEHFGFETLFRSSCWMLF